MYKYEENNFNKYVMSMINKYLKIIYLFIAFSIIGFFIVMQSGDTLFSKILSLICSTVFIIGIILIPTFKFSFKNTAKLICENYQFDINNTISFNTVLLSSFDGIANVNAKQYIIKNIDSYEDVNGKIIIHGNILIKKRVQTSKGFKTKDIQRNKCYVLKGISNIEEFKQELERLKNG